MKNFFLLFLLRCFKLIVFPKLALNRLREEVYSRTSGKIKNNLPLDNLPAVKLIAANDEEKLAEVVRLYLRNPSRLVIAPRSNEKMKELISKGYEYFLFVNELGDFIGAVGWQSDRSMDCHKVIDVKSRGKGFSLSSTKVFHTYLAQKGYKKSYRQVLKNNTRAISESLSSGYLVESEDPDGDFLLLSKQLNAFDKNLR